MRRFLDTTILVYAFGLDHPLREPCQRILAQVADGQDEAHVSTEVMQEFLFHRMRRTDRGIAVEETRDAAAFCILHPFDRSVFTRALTLVESSDVRGRDAVHAATALETGFTEIVSADTDFDRIPGLTRIDPTDF